MPESGEDQRMEMFFKNVIKSFGELQATKALQQQAEMVASTIGGHVREVLGPVQEGVDVIKNTFENTWSFVKGTFDDLSGFFSTGDQIEERAYRGTSLQQGAEIIEESQRSNEMFVQAQEGEWERFEAQMDAFGRMYELEQAIVDEVKEGFRQVYEGVMESSKIAKEKLEKEKGDRLAKLRETKKLDRTFLDRLIDLVMTVIFGPFIIIAGLIAGFVGTFAKVLATPFKLLAGLGRILGILPKAEKVTKVSKGLGRFFKFFEEIPILGRFFGLLARNKYFAKIFRLGKFLGSKVLFPLFVFFDAISGLAKYKKIFGKGAGIREAIESAIAGILSGLTQLPAKIVEWIVKKTTGIEIDIAKYFSLESWAKALHKITGWFNDKVVQPIKGYVEDPETQKRWDELAKTTEDAKNAFNEMIKGWRDKLKTFAEKYLMDDEETRKKWQNFEDQTPEMQELMVQQVVPGEAGMAFRASRLSPEELAERRQKFEESGLGKFLSEWGGYAKDQFNVSKKIDQTIDSLNQSLKELTAFMKGEGKAASPHLRQAIANTALMVNPGSAVTGAMNMFLNDPKEELPNAGVLLNNKGGP